jgi:hypothetical protein
LNGCLPQVSPLDWIWIGAPMPAHRTNQGTTVLHLILARRDLRVPRRRTGREARASWAPWRPLRGNRQVAAEVMQSHHVAGPSVGLPPVGSQLLAPTREAPPLHLPTAKICISGPRTRMASSSLLMSRGECLDSGLGSSPVAHGARHNILGQCRSARYGS